MSLKTITGDLLKIEEGVILHQVNTKGATGGLAGALRRKWPKAFERYLQACRTENDPRGVLTYAGSCVIGSQVDDGREVIVAHIFGQIYPGPNTDLKLVDSALEDFAIEYEAYGNGCPVYAPYQMGCGLGGGNWREYSAVIEKQLPDCIIVKLPERKTP